MGGPGEICLPLNIAFAPSTWVALSLLLLLLVEGTCPLPLRSARSKESQVVSCPRSSFPEGETARPRERARTMEAEIFILTRPERALFIPGIDFANAIGREGRDRG